MPPIELRAFVYSLAISLGLTTITFAVLIGVFELAKIALAYFGAPMFALLLIYFIGTCVAVFALIYRSMTSERR